MRSFTPLSSIVVISVKCHLEKQPSVSNSADLENKTQIAFRNHRNACKKE